MPDIMDNRVFSQMAEIAECLCGKIAENDLPKVCFCGIIAGALPYDAQGVGGECYDEMSNPVEDAEGCGQAWVRLTTAYPSSAVGFADTTPGNCSKGFGYDIEIGITRCIRIVENGGSLPADEMLGAVQLQIADMLTMQQAILCCSSFAGENSVLGQYTPIGPEGGVVGGSWVISVAAD